MGTVYMIFVVVAAPLIFCMLTWVVVTAYRILAPEEPLPFEHDPVMIRQKAAAHGKPVRVGVREIREDQRHQLAGHVPGAYQYSYGDSEGLPARWVNDLHQRRN